MSNFSNQACSYCINASNATESHRLKICHNEIGSITSSKDMLTGADFTDAAFLAEIEKFILGEALTAGFVIEKRETCTLEYAYPDFELCGQNSAGELTASYRITEKQDAETGETVLVQKATIVSSNDTNLVEGTTYTAFANEVVFLSGSYATGDLIIEVNGVELTQANCIECSNCG